MVVRAEDDPIPDDFKAPEPGSNVEFDDLAARVWSSVVKGGGLGGITEDDARRRLAYALTKYGGKQFTDGGS